MEDDMKRELAGIRSRLDGVDKRFDSVESAIRRVAVEQVRLRHEFSDFTDTVKALFKQEFQRIKAVVDDLVPLIENARHDRSRNDAAFMRHQDRLDDHERRLYRLEARNKGA